MNIECPSCEQPIEITVDHCGTGATCPTCSTEFMIPTAEEFGIAPAPPKPTAAAAAPALAPQSAPVLRTAQAPAISAPQTRPASPYQTPQTVAPLPNAGIDDARFRDKGLGRLGFFFVMLASGLLGSFVGGGLSAVLEQALGETGFVIGVIVMFGLMIGLYIWAVMTRADNIGWAKWVGIILLIVPFGTSVLQAMPPNYKFHRQLDAWFWVLIILTVLSLVVSVLIFFGTIWALLSAEGVG